MTSTITRALDLQQRTLAAMFEILSQADLIVIEAAMGARSDKRAVADLLDLFTSDEFLALEDQIKGAVAAATIAHGFEPFVTKSKPPTKKPKSEAKPRRKAVPKDPRN